MHEPCRIEIKLTAGTIVSCSIVTDSGQRLPEKESIKKISRLGPLFWTFVPQAVAASPAPPTHVRKEEIFFPQHIAQVEQGQIRTWSRIHRMVFALADGTRSVAKIAEILSVAPDLVDRALRDLQSIGVITMGPLNGKSHF